MFKVLACFLIFSVLILILRVENNLLFAYINYSLNIFTFLILVFQITINNIINILFIINLILIITIQSSNY